MECKGVQDARLVNLFSFCFSLIGGGKCLRAPWLASVGFKTANLTCGTSERTWCNRRLHGTTSATVIIRFFSRSLVGGFSLQSWCVQGSIGSAEGSVLPPSDGNSVEK